MDELLKVEFCVNGSFFYEDQFGFETEDTVDTAAKAAEFVHRILGLRLGTGKSGKGNRPKILGIVYDLEEGVLKIDEERKEALLEEMRQLFHEERLLPAQASKLKGKLGFGATPVWVRLGRARLRPLSERKCSNGYSPYRDAEEEEMSR